METITSPKNKRHYSPKRPKTERTCLICGKAFVRPAPKSGNYCSRSCANTGRYKALSGPSAERTCPVCGITFRVPHSSNPKQYCNTECYKLRGELVKARLWAKVIKAPDNGCWLWQGGRAEGGYGRFIVNGRPTYTHRFVYELTFGPIPEGLSVCHHCDNPPCCRPDHLFLGSQADNAADMWAKGRGYVATPIVHRGEAHYRARLSDTKVRYIREQHAMGKSYTELAATLDVSRATVTDACQGKTWKHIP